MAENKETVEAEDGREAQQLRMACLDLAVRSYQPGTNDQLITKRAVHFVNYVKEGKTSG